MAVVESRMAPLESPAPDFSLRSVTGEQVSLGITRTPRHCSWDSCATTAPTRGPVIGGGGQFGLVDVRDDGRTIRVTITGRNWLNEVLFTRTFDAARGLTDRPGP